MAFEFMDKGNAVRTCVSYAGRMHIFNEENIWNLIRSTLVADEFDEDRLKNVIDVMSLPSSLDIVLRSKTFEGKFEKEVDFYHTKYSIEKFSDELLAKINTPNCKVSSCKIDLPPPNTLVPKNFDILEKDESLSAQP